MPQMIDAIEEKKIKRLSRLHVEMSMDMTNRFGHIGAHTGATAGVVLGLVQLEHTRLVDCVAAHCA